MTIIVTYITEISLMLQILGKTPQNYNIATSRMEYKMRTERLEN
jgi:hypothetical protein